MVRCRPWGFETVTQSVLGGSVSNELLGRRSYIIQDHRKVLKYLNIFEIIEKTIF